MGRTIAVFVVGVAVGWGVSFWTREPDPARRSREVEPREEKAESPRAEPQAPKSREEAEPETDVLAVFRTGSAVAVLRKVEEAEPHAAWLSVIPARLAQARADRDWRLYRALLSAVARVDSPEAHALLLELVRDETLEFPQRMGRFFALALKNAEVEGIAEAARDRIERNAAAGKNSWVGIEGWADLIAGQGDAAMIRWLADLDLSAQFGKKACEALCRSSNPEAVEFVVAAVLDGNEAFREGIHLRSFARNNPEHALDTLEALHRDRESGIDARALARAVAETANEDTLARVEAILRAPRTPRERIEFCYAVQRLESKGLDHSALDFLLEAPVEMLERVAAGTASRVERELKSKARYAIEYNPVLWSERAVAALEATGYAEEAAKIRSRLEAEWRTG